MGGSETICWDIIRQIAARIIINIPGVDDYNSIKPRVYKQTVNGTMAADDSIDIDDFQTMGGLETIC